MKYEDDQIGLRQLFQDLEPVPDTFPPVYFLDDVLIGYGKDGRVTVIAAQKEAGNPTGWRTRLFTTLGRVLIGDCYGRLVDSQMGSKAEIDDFAWGRLNSSDLTG